MNEVENFLKSMFFAACLLLLVCVTAMLARAQHTPKCPVGKQYQFGLSTSSLILPSGCFTEAQIKKMDHDLAVNMCSEGGMFIDNGEWEYVRSSDWNNVADRCDSSEHWYRVRLNEDERDEIEVTKEEYMQGTCTYEVTCNGAKCRVLYPKPEWTHCRESQ